MFFYILSSIIILGIIRYLSKARKDAVDSNLWQLREISLYSPKAGHKVRIENVIIDWWNEIKEYLPNKNKKSTYIKFVTIIINFVVQKYIDQVKLMCPKIIDDYDKFTQKLFNSIDFNLLNLNQSEGKVKLEILGQQKGLTSELEEVFNVNFEKENSDARVAIEWIECEIDFKEYLSNVNNRIVSEIATKKNERWSTAKHITLFSFIVFLLWFSWLSYGIIKNSQNGYVTVTDGCLKTVGDDCSRSVPYWSENAGTYDCNCVLYQYKTISIQEGMIKDLASTILISIIGGIIIYFIKLSREKS